MKRETIPLFKVHMSPTAADDVAKVLNSGYIGEGPKVKEFEDALAKKLIASSKPTGYTDIITCNSATSCEHLIYHYLKQPRKLIQYYEWGSTVINWDGFDVKKHNVLTTPLTCTATNFPIILNGMRIKWVDIDPLTMNVDLDDLESKIDVNTRIITVVHWGGYPVDLDRLRAIVRRAKEMHGHEILIIEDCAHAFGSSYKGTPVGFHGNIGTYSTQAIKHLTSVDGGFITSPFTDLTEKAKLLRWYGIDRNTPRTDFRCEQDIPEIGFKFHMNDVNATIGLSNLKYIDSVVSKHKINGAYYNSKLADVDSVRLIQQCTDGYDSAYWLYTMLVEDRDNFMRMMNEKGISVSRVHERNDKHSSLAQFKCDLPLLNSFVDDMICIPVGWWVTSEDREYIVDCIKAGW